MVFAPGRLPDGTHFCKKKLDSGSASKPQPDHAHGMSLHHCDLSELLEKTRPPDPDFVDLSIVVK